MTFALVFIEACRGTFEPGTVSEFPENIKLLYASGDRFLQYQTIDYPQLVVVAERQGLFSAAYDQQLSAKYLAIFRQTDSPPWLRWLWFVPAVLFGWLWLRQRSRPGIQADTQA